MATGSSTQPLEPLQPTLWRTCRVLANRTRLNLFRFLLERPGATVSEVAQAMGQPLPLTSQYLRALEARGLLIARRTGRWVRYRPTRRQDGTVSAGLAVALRATFQRETAAVEIVLRLATAFTHPRRAQIFQVLRVTPCSVAALQARTHISSWALLRHLKKLEARGFIIHLNSQFTVATRKDVLGRELLRLARDERIKSTLCEVCSKPKKHA
jgi:DNA-binding transcriptional ArsR family regulator